jgi:uncharacterized damage-inducible protein DinB
VSTDPLLAAAAALLDDSLNDLRAALDGLSTEALNWRPAGAETNSIAVLATHSLHSTRAWLTVALGLPYPERDRPSEFRTEAPDAMGLHALLEDFGGQCRRMLLDARDIDWSAMRATAPRNRPGASEDESAAFSIVHALQHLREHTGQMALTRQLWEQRT